MRVVPAAPAARSAISVETIDDNSCTDLLILVNCSSELNCASWATKSVSVCGFVGSWFFSFVTSNCRNASLPRLETVFGDGAFDASV